MGIHDLIGPKSARVFLTVYDAQAPFASDDVATMHLNSLPGELAGLSAVETWRRPVTARIGVHTVTGTEVDFSVALSGVEVPHMLRVFTWREGERTGSLVFQVARRDQARVAAGVEQVLASLVIQPVAP